MFLITNISTFTFYSLLIFYKKIRASAIKHSNNYSHTFMIMQLELNSQLLFHTMLFILVALKHGTLQYTGV